MLLQFESNCIIVLGKGFVVLRMRLTEDRLKTSNGLFFIEHVLLGVVRRKEGQLALGGVVLGLERL